MRMWRSLLFVPANQKRMLDKLNDLPSDGFILDLEDTIPSVEKANARAMALEYMPQVPGARCWVRVNPFDSGFLEDDIQSFVGIGGLAGFVVPKQDRLEDVQQVDALISDAERRKGVEIGSTPIIAMIESASGVLNSQKVVAGSPRIESIIYGGGEDGDMNVSLGATWTSAGPEMMFVRQFSLVAARSANIACPLDGVFSNIRDAEGFRQDTELSRRLGFRGRTAIHPNQLEMTNDIYTPTAAQIDYYTRVIVAFDEALTRGTASTTVDGKLVDVAMVKTAHRLLDHMAAIRELEALVGHRARRT